MVRSDEQELFSTQTDHPRSILIDVGLFRPRHSPHSMSGLVFGSADGYLFFPGCKRTIWPMPALTKRCGHPEHISTNARFSFYHMHPPRPKAVSDSAPHLGVYISMPIEPDVVWGLQCTVNDSAGGWSSFSLSILPYIHR